MREPARITSASANPPSGNRQLALPVSEELPKFNAVTDAATIHAPKRQKELGAFYTPPAMARALIDWAVREPSDRVLDPSFGGLVFLTAAEERLSQLGARGGSSSEQVFGVDLDSVAQSLAMDGTQAGLGADQLLHRDFFDVRPSELPPIDAVVGNPPYIRYQGFNGSAARARELTAGAGVKLTRLASSWAPFVVHGTSFLAPRGRLAQVLPAEILHSQYAGEVIEFLRRSFGRVQIAVFEDRVFPGALEEVVLLFADDRGAPGLADVRLVPCQGVDDVRAALARSSRATEAQSAAPGSRGKLLAQLLPANTQALYEMLSQLDDVDVMGEIATVDIGIVTGANEFFMLSREDAAGLDPELLRAGVSKAAHLAGARLRPVDHEQLLQDGHRALMFVANSNSPAEALESARPRIDRGELDGFDKRYKCRIRDPWWALPLPQRGGAALLLTYCSNDHPRLAVNEVDALSTNTLHGVRPMAEGLADRMAAGFYNSLTLLSAEIVGRSYGGGVLKLEPTEAEALLMPTLPSQLEGVLPAVDEAIRRRDLDTALDLVDPLVLGPLGLEEGDISLLRSGRQQLARRRKRRGRPAK